HAFGDEKDLRDRHRSPQRMWPARERLESHDDAVAQAHDGLEVQPQVAVRKGSGKLVFEAHLLQRAPARNAVEDLATAAAARPGPADRELRVELAEQPGLRGQLAPLLEAFEGMTQGARQQLLVRHATLEQTILGASPQSAQGEILFTWIG